KVQVEVLHRTGDSFQSPYVVTTMNLSCTLTSPFLRILSPHHFVASLDESCEQGVSRRLGVFSLERYPRLLEQLLLAPPGEIPLEVGLRSFDQDLDGYEDIAVDLSIERPGNDEPARLSMVWLDRPSGLAKDAQEPFATFAAMFERVKGALAKDPS